MRNAGRQEAAGPIRWRLVLGVVALQVTLQLGWMIYRAYQPALLTGHGLSQLLPLFALLPGALGLVIEPLAGWLSDRRDPSARGRLLPVSVGVLLAGLIFLGVVGLLRGGLPPGGMLLPLLMVAWMVAVQSSASPALAVLKEAAPLGELPRAAALITFAQGMLGALESSITTVALRLGPGLTFVLGAALLALGLGVLRVLPSFPPARKVPMAQERVPPRSALLFLGLALTVGALTSSLLTLLPRTHAGSLSGIAGVTPAAAVLIVSALAAPGAGALASRWGQRRALARGVALLAALLAIALLAPAALVPLLPLLGMAYSLVATSLTAAALATLPAGCAGLGSGLVLGGSGAAGTLLILLLGSSGPLAAAPVLSAVGLSTLLALLTLPQLAQASAAEPP